MNSEVAPAPVPAAPPGRPARRSFGQRRAKSASSLSAHGQPMVWLTGGLLAVSLAMICGLLGLVAYQGFGTFWPVPLVRIKTFDGQAYLGEVAREEETRKLLRTGNFELSGSHFHWVDDDQIKAQWQPDWGLVVERLNWGRFYGVPDAFLVDGR